MVDNVSKDKRSKIMSSIRSMDTKPELAVRKILTKLGYRYRLHRKDLPGTPDIVFFGRKKVIFVNGCFWHAHKNCKISHIPENEFWKKKILTNVQRDQKNLYKLKELGWSYLVLWECEIADIKKTTERIQKFLQ